MTTALSLPGPASAFTVPSTAATALNGSDPRAMARLGKAKGAAEDFEAAFLNSMFQQMFSGVGEGPFSGGPGAQVWRSFLTDEYAKSFVKAGGIGIAAQVQRELLKQQEMK
jgi:Rod binding domain-containing protein